MEKLKNVLCIVCIVLFPVLVYLRFYTENTNATVFLIDVWLIDSISLLGIYEWENKK